MEEKEGSCRLKLVDSPQIGFNNYDYENLKHFIKAERSYHEKGRNIRPFFRKRKEGSCHGEIRFCYASGSLLQ